MRSSLPLLTLLQDRLEHHSFVFSDLFKKNFGGGCVGSSLLRTGFLSSCGERGLLFVAVRGLLIAVASLVAELWL